jgi:hypothetical protein
VLHVRLLLHVRLQGFLQQMETAMAKHPLFAASSPAELDAATEVRQGAAANSAAATGAYAVGSSTRLTHPRIQPDLTCNKFS